MAKRRTDEERLLELIEQKDAAYEVLESLERRGVFEPAAGDLLWGALRAGALGAKWREGLFSWRSPYLRAMAGATQGFDVTDLAALVAQLALALGEAEDTADAAEWDRPLDQMIAACTGDRRALVAAHAALAEPARARVGAALTRAGLLAPRRQERAALLRHAAECALHGGDTSYLDTAGEAERSRLILEAASRRDDPRRYLIGPVVEHLPRASEEELIGIGIRTWEVRPVNDEIAARGEAAFSALAAEAARLLESEAEDEDWTVVVTARLAALHAQRGEPFPERQRPLLDRSIALSRAPRKTLTGPAYPRDNPFYAFTDLVHLLSPDEVIDLALRCFQVRVPSAIAIFTPLGDTLVPALSARARALLAAPGAKLVELAVIVLGLGQRLLERGESLPPDLDPLLGALVAGADDLVPREVRAKMVLYDPAHRDGDARALVAAVLCALPLDRREALLIQAPKVPFFFSGTCPTPAFAERVIARVAALDDIDVRAQAPNIAAAFAALDAAARVRFAEEALAARDRTRRTVGAMALETLPPSPEIAALARKKLASERAKGVREVLERIVKRGPNQR